MVQIFLNCTHKLTPHSPGDRKPIGKQIPSDGGRIDICQTLYEDNISVIEGHLEYTKGLYHGIIGVVVDFGQTARWPGDGR